jgi:Zn-dependent protease with chaperone function
MIPGRFFDGASSTGANATLALGADGIARVYGLPDHRRIEAPVAELDISERVGNIARRVTFPGGGMFETRENDAIDEALQSLNLKPKSGWVHNLESRWRIAAASLVAIVVVSVGFVQWGIPALASQAARVIPPEADRAIGIGTLETFDKTFFDTSELPTDRSAALRQRFADMIEPLDDGHEYRLEFRKAGEMGANAFALPSGIIVVTDELVELSESDDEIVAVLAPEIGHVRQRHALRQILQAAGVSVLAVTVLGDVGSLSSILSAAPALLTAKHSRDFEREADSFAKQWLREHDIDETNFDRILCRMTQSHGASDSDSPDAVDFFSSHPPTDERARCEAAAN